MTTISMTTIRSPMTRRALRRTRTCPVCLAVVPDGPGTIYHAGLGVYVHQGACMAVVDGEIRVYDRSRRGRWRPRGEVLARIAGRREGRP